MTSMPGGSPPLLGPRSGLLLLGEVEDPAVRLPQVLLLLEVHLEGSLDGHKCDAPLKERERERDM